MSKNRKLYDLEIEYENLSGPYKAIYDELGLSLQDMSVLEIRHFADDFGIDPHVVRKRRARRLHCR